MATRFVNIDRRTPMLLPADLRDWVAEDDLVHFLIECVEGFDLRGFAINERGSGSEQFPPAMMLGLLIYNYANGIFSSRRIEAATYRDVAVRYLCANTHPDHDTICEFRRRNFEAIAECFLKVLLLARELKLLKVGTVSVDGTRLDAAASKHRNVTYGRAGELIGQLQSEIAELLEKAEAADQAQEGDPGRLPQEIARRESLKGQLEAARRRLEEQVAARAVAEQAVYERKLKEREQRKYKGKKPRPPRGTPEPQAQMNLTDPDSALMRRSKNAQWRQGYNAHAVVDAEGSQLILGARLTNCGTDNTQLLPDIESVPEELKPVKIVLADAGFGNGKQVEVLTQRGIEVLVNVQAQAAHLRRRHDFRPVDSRSESPVRSKAPWRKAMKEKLQSKEGQALYAKRWSTVEPVFGTIKAAIGFRHFLLRGLDRVSGEWQLVCLAYNFRRLHKLRAAQIAPYRKPIKSKKLGRCPLGLSSAFRFKFNGSDISLAALSRPLKNLSLLLELLPKIVQSPTSS